MTGSAPLGHRPRLLFFVAEDWYFCSHRLPLARAAVQAGFDVAVATRVRNHGDAIRRSGIRVIPVEIDRGGLNPVAAIGEILQLTRLYRRERPDIVHHVALKPVLYGSVAARMAGVPQVVNALTGLGWLFTSTSRKARWLKPVIGRVLRHLLRPTAVIVQNREDAALVGEWNVRQTHLIRGAGVDCEMFRPAVEPEGEPLVVLPARMLWDKGVGEFVAAARSIAAAGHSARFALVGAPDPDNPASVPVEQLAAWRDKGVVEWWGRIEDMPSVYAQAHIVCLPSYREGLPKSLLEAAAAGLPIVTADVPGCREIVQHELNGLLVPARDGHSLATALSRLISDPEMRRSMGLRGRQRAKAEFSQEQVVAETLAVYRESLV
jgi:glycosyltransferase involved in cell wall biosynthesis